MGCGRGSGLNQFNSSETHPYSDATSVSNICSESEVYVQ